MLRWYESIAIIALSSAIVYGVAGLAAHMLLWALS